MIEFWMGFCFGKNESVARAIPRLGCERVRRALKLLDKCATSEAIHGARKEIKKAKATLRLARATISRSEFRKLKKDLRRAAKRLAKPRDAAVQANTLRDLSRRFKSDLPSGAFRNFRVELRRASDRAMRKFEQKERAKSACDILQDLARRFRDLQINQEGWKALAPAVKRAYRDCRDAYEGAAKSGSAKAFHQWRKRAKDLWHQITLFEPAAPETIGRMARELEAVGDCLGEDHDLFVLQTKLETSAKLKNADSAQEMAPLWRIIHERQKELRGKALATGKYFYAERPDEFCRRLGTYWRAWRKKSSRRLNRSEKKA